MSLYNLMARHLMAPTLDMVRGCKSMACLAELEQSQWWAPDKIEELQRERLQRTIQHAYSHVPYYRQVMQEQGIKPGSIRSVLDLVNLPVLTKAIVRNRIDDMVADDVAQGDLLRSRTGGSTGSPLAFFTTKHDWYSHGRSRGLLAMEWAGVALGDRVVSFSSGFGAPSPLERRIEPLSLLFRRATKVRLSTMSVDGCDDVVRLLHRTKPKALAAYPSTLNLLATHIRDSGRPAPPLRAILTGGEQVFDDQRTAIREVFGLEPYSRYGSHENYLLATECEQHTGMHVFAQDLVLEVVDEEGSPVAPGSEGRILITNLHARGMPFIRYDTGDVGSYATSPCTCGRGMPLLDRLSGRRCDTIYTRSGARIAGTGVGMSRFALLGASQFQLVQEDMDHLTARLVVSGSLTSEEQVSIRQRAVDILRRSLGPDIDISVELVDHIELSPAGKYVPIISKVDPNSCLRRTAR